MFAPASPPTPVTSSAAASGPTVNDASNDIVIEIAPVPVVDEGSVRRSKQSIRLDNASDQVVRTWILWILDIVHSHHSITSSANKGKLFRSMFENHPCAESFGSFSKGKIRYIINHGLAVYFRNIFMNELRPSDRLPPRFVSCFDESFNTVTYSKQLDLHLLYFDEKIRQVHCVYVGSQFMGHGTAVDTMVEFKNCHGELDIINNLVQLSMDGPNVNWLFHKDLENYRKEVNPKSPLLLVMGSCGIHVLNGAYKTAHTKETDWDVMKTLKQLIVS